MHLTGAPSDGSPDTDAAFLEPNHSYKVGLLEHAAAAKRSSLALDSHSSFCLSMTILSNAHRQLGWWVVELVPQEHRLHPTTRHGLGTQFLVLCFGHAVWRCKAEQRPVLLLSLFSGNREPGWFESHEGRLQVEPHLRVTGNCVPSLLIPRTLPLLFRTFLLFFGAFLLLLAPPPHLLVLLFTSLIHQMTCLERSLDALEQISQHSDTNIRCFSN